MRIQNAGIFCSQSYDFSQLQGKMREKMQKNNQKVQVRQQKQTEVVLFIANNRRFNEL